MGPEGVPDEPRDRPRGRLALVIGVALALVGAGIAAAVLADRPPSPACSTPPPPANESDYQSLVLVSCGTRVLLAADSYASYSLLRLSDAQSVVGEDRANVSVGVYMLSADQLNALSGNRSAPPSMYEWTCGTGTACAFSQEVPPSPFQYYLVVDNPGAGMVSLTWSETVVLYYYVSP